MTRSLALAGSLFALALGAATANAAAPGGGTCSTHGLAFSSVRVVGLHVDGVACLQARDLAGQIARHLLHGRSIPISGAESFGVSQQACTGCKTTTSVSVTYAAGEVRVALQGGSGAAAAPSIPTLPAIPTIPTGPGTVV
jgi:hypothetical protein